MQAPDIAVSIETADRVLERAAQGVAAFRLMNAAEEQHVIRALYHWRSIGYGVPDLLAEIAALRAEKDARDKRITEGMEY
jgi:hypothetical protein